MSKQTMKQTVGIATNLAVRVSYEAADRYLDLIAEVWGEEVALAVATAVWG